MRELRFVSLAEDGDLLLLESADGVERFCLRPDPGLRDAVAPGTVLRGPAVEPAPPAAVAPPAPPPPLVAEPLGPATDAIGPREIQMRVRAGESPDTLATLSGMPVERIMRFAGPVLDERRRIADEARRARARRTGSDAGENRFVMFGEAVDERFGAHGITAESVTWDARRRDDGEWLVAASWVGGQATHGAEWLFSRASRSVTPMDDTAADLLSDKPIRPIAPPAPPAVSLVAAPPLVPGVVAFPPMPDAHTSPLPPVEEVFDQEAPPEGPREIPSLVPAAAAVDYDAPPLPLGITEPPARPGVGALRNLGAGRREESDEERAARARVPSWDDILLGIRRKD